jgi:tetratricopeptide (TPR) repeat protein
MTFSIILIIKTQSPRGEGWGEGWSFVIGFWNFLMTGGLMKRWIIGSILILFFFLSFLISWGQEQQLNTGGMYDSAIEFFYQGRYDEAIERFSELVLASPNSKLVPYSQFMIGQCHLKMERNEEALRQFELYLKTYPDGDRVGEAEKGILISKEKLKGEKGRNEIISSQAKGMKRRICAQVLYFDGKTLGEVEKKVKQLKNAGVDTLIVKAFQNKGDRIYKFATPLHEEGVYFKTEYAPVVDDILGKIAEIVHRNGLDIFAWITTRYANYGSEGNPEYRCKSYNFETKKMELAKGFNLFHPDVVKRLEGLFRDLGRYPIDGILFQDDLILYHNEDFSNDANKAFLKEFGYSPHPDLFYIDPYKSDSGKYYVKAYTERFRTWANWKNRWLMDVAKRLMKASRESNPNLQFAVNLYFEAVINDFNGVAWFSETLSEALKNDFDYYAVMAYHRKAMKDRNIGMKEAIDLMAEAAEKAVKAVGDPAKVLMKVQILDLKGYEVVPKKEVEQILTKILEQGNVSLAFMPYIDQFPLSSIKGKWTNPK